MSPRESSEVRNIKIKLCNVPKEGMHMRVTGSSVHGLLFPLLQSCVTGQQSKCKGELIISERNIQVCRQLWRVAIGGIGSDE